MNTAVKDHEEGMIGESPAVEIPALLGAGGSRPPLCPPPRPAPRETPPPPTPRPHPANATASAANREVHASAAKTAPRKPVPAAAERRTSRSNAAKSGTPAESATGQSARPAIVPSEPVATAPTEPSSASN